MKSTSSLLILPIDPKQSPINHSVASPFKFSVESPAFVPTCLHRGEDHKETEKQRSREEKMVHLAEFYLSDENLLNDSYLQFAMAASQDDFIKINTICSFNRMKKLKANPKRLAELLVDSPSILLSENHKSFKRRQPHSQEFLIKRRTLLVERLDEDLFYSSKTAFPDTLWTESGLKSILAFAGGRKIVVLLLYVAESVSFRTMTPENRITSINYASSLALESSSPFLAPNLNDSLVSPVILSSSPNVAASSVHTPQVTTGVAFSALASMPLVAKQALVVFPSIELALKALDGLATEHRLKAAIQCVSYASLQREKMVLGTPLSRASASSVIPEAAIASGKKANTFVGSPTFVASFRKSPAITPALTSLVPVSPAVGVQIDDHTKSNGVFGRWSARKVGISPSMRSVHFDSPKLAKVLIKLAKGPDGSKGFSLIRTKTIPA